MKVRRRPRVAGETPRRDTKRPRNGPPALRHKDQRAHQQPAWDGEVGGQSPRIVRYGKKRPKERNGSGFWITFGHARIESCCPGLALGSPQVLNLSHALLMRGTYSSWSSCPLRPPQKRKCARCRLRSLSIETSEIEVMADGLIPDARKDRPPDRAFTQMSEVWGIQPEGRESGKPKGAFERFGRNLRASATIGPGP